MAASSASCVIFSGLQSRKLFDSIEAQFSELRFNCVRGDHIERGRLLWHPSATVACSSSSRRASSAIVTSSLDESHPSSSGGFGSSHSPGGWRNLASKGSTGRRGRRTRNVATMALPEGTVWITALEAVTVAGLMGAVAVAAGVFINIKIETMALKEYEELKKKGQLPKEMIIPNGDWDLEEPLYLFEGNELSSDPTPRNRPIREEVEPEVKSEVEPELEVVTTEKV